MNPYEVLGVPEGSDEETIKRAYKELVKKYHPDRYVNNPLADLASEKLKEVNKAYDMLMNKNAGAGGGQSSGGYTGGHSYGRNAGNGGYSGQVSFQSVRILINMGNTVQAMNMLGQLPKNAEWNYLMGLCCLRQGKTVDGVNYIKTACNMDPNNIEYRNTLNNIQSGNTGYRNVNPMGGASACDCCSTLCVADCCCEMCGGDLIPCC